MVSKAQILAGARYHEPLYVPEFEHDGCGGTRDDCDGLVKVRALSDGEQGEADVAAMAGQVVEREFGGGRRGPRTSKIDVAESSRGQLRARRIKVAYGLSVDENWTPEDVALLPPAAVDRVAAKVRLLSNGDDGQPSGEDTDEGDTGEDEPDGEEGEPESGPARFRGDPAGPNDRDPAPDRPASGDDSG